MRDDLEGDCDLVLYPHGSQANRHGADAKFSLFELAPSCGFQLGFGLLNARMDGYWPRPVPDRQVAVDSQLMVPLRLHPGGFEPTHHQGAAEG